MSPYARARWAWWLVLGLGLGLLALRVAAAGTAPHWGYQVVATYPHDPDAYTQGLLWSDGHLYESTGLYGHSELRRVELASGRVLLVQRLPQRLFGEGLAKLGDGLYQLTWREGECRRYAAADLTLAGRFTYEGEGWGLTTDGRQLYMSDGSDRIAVRDPSDFRVLREVRVHDGAAPVGWLNELELIGGQLWANVYRSPEIAIIAPEDGRVAAWLDLSALLAQQGSGAEVLNGIAHDPVGGRIFVTGKRWPRLYEIRVVR